MLCTIPASALSAFLLFAVMFGVAGSEDRQPLLEWHVVPAGNDAESGAAGRPFATVERALDELARRRSANDQRPATIVLHDGRYAITRPLQVETRHSSPTGTLTIHAADGARPVISGGRCLSGWVKRDDGTFTLPLDDVSRGQWVFRELFVNGQRRPRARHPNTDFLRVAASFPDKRSGFTFGAGDIPAGVDGGAELVFLHDWSISRVGVKAIDHQRRRLTTTDPIGVAGNYFSIDFFEPNPRYFLEGHPALLDAPGEWHLDRAGGMLLYRPLAGETPEALPAVAPVAPALLIVRGSDAAPVQNIHFRGITFAHASWPLPPGGYAGLQATVREKRDGKSGAAALKASAESFPAGSPERDTGRMMAMIPAAVRFELAEDCSVVDCRIAHVGMSGVAFGSRTRRCRLEGCVIEDTSANGVNVGEDSSRLVGDKTWWEAKPDEAAAQHVLVNNLIQSAGRQFFGAVGIWVGLAHDIRIAHNEVRDLPYTGISLGWMWSPAPTPAGKNVVEYNHIHHVMQTLSDGGGIYTLGRQPGSLLTGNHIHHVPVNLGRAESNGMFLDEGTDDFTIAGNLIYATARSPLRFHQARNNVVRANVLAVPDGETPAIRYNSTDPNTIRQIANTILEPGAFDPARHRSIIDAAGPEPAYGERFKTDPPQ